MNIHKVNGLFSDPEIEYLNKMINNIRKNEDSHLGRVKSDMQASLTDQMVYKMYKIVNEMSEKEIHMTSFSFAEYSSKYGEPNLPPHLDGDSNDIVVDFQLSANTCWDLGINTNLYSLEDNSALIFNANTNVHWRPRKKFQDGEYVKMLFFRFGSQENPSDYSDKCYSIDHDIFKEAREMRDSITQH